MDALVIDDARQINEAIAATESLVLASSLQMGKARAISRTSEREGRQSIALKGGLTGRMPPFATSFRQRRSADVALESV